MKGNKNKNKSSNSTTRKKSNDLQLDLLPIPKSKQEYEDMVEQGILPAPETIAQKEARQKEEAEIRKNKRIASKEALLKRKADPNYSPLKGLPGESFKEMLYNEAEPMVHMGRISDEDNFFDDYINPLHHFNRMAGNLGTAPLEAEQSDSYLPYVAAVGEPLIGGGLAGAGAKSTKQFVNNAVNPLAGVKDYLTSRTALKNTYNLNPNALKRKDVDFLYRWDSDKPFVGLENNPVLNKYRGRWAHKNNPENLMEYLKIRPGSGTVSSVAVPKNSANLPSDAKPYVGTPNSTATGLNNLYKSETIIPKPYMNKLTKTRIKNNPMSDESVDFWMDSPHARPAIDKLRSAEPKPHWLKGYKYGGKMIGDKDRIQYGDGGSFWRNAGASAFGVLEGTVNSATMGLTSSPMDSLYNRLDSDGTTAGARGVGRTVGAVGTAVATGGATTKGSMLEATKGTGQATREFTDNHKVNMITGITEAGANLGSSFMGNSPDLNQLFSAKYGGRMPKRMYMHGGQMEAPEVMGNEMSPQHTINEFEGLTHAQGGIPIGNDVEVEDGEFKYKDMIFSNALTYEEE